VAVGLVPLVLRYERQKNEYLDARQRELETLAESIGGAVGQVSLAANALQDIADLAHRNLRMAEHLPHKLQDKIAEFQSQLSATTDVEKEELEKELLALRTSESERLESVSQRIAKSTAEWARLETVSQQHLAAANETVARLASDTAGAIGRAQAAAEHALSEAKAATLAEIDARLSAATDALIARVTAELGVPAKAGAPAAVAAPHPPATGN